MNIKKRVLLGMVFGIMILSIVSVSAGWRDWFTFGEEEEGLEGELAESADVTITMANAPPTIQSWTQPTPTTVTACSVTLITFTVTMFDDNGDSDLVGGASGVSVNLTRTGEQDRPAIPAACIPGTPNGDKLLVFSCSVNMQFYDQTGDWTITVTATDSAGDSATNSPQASDGGVNYPYFPYGSLLAIELADTNDPTVPLDTLQWTGVTSSTVNDRSDTDMIVTNCGNVDITASGTSWLSIIGRDLISATDPITNTDKIEPNSFLVDENTLPDPCGLGQTINKPAADLNIDGASLLRGAAQTRNLYFCIGSINPTGSAVSADNYETQASPNNWGIDASE